RPLTCRALPSFPTRRSSDLPEHLQMGMVGQIYVRPRQDRVALGGDLYASLQQQELDNRTKCDSTQDILCSNPLPAINTAATAARSEEHTSELQSRGHLVCRL